MVSDSEGDPGPTDSQVIAHSWAETDRFIPRRVVRPLQRLMSFEISTAVLILVAVVVAMVLANSGLAEAYEDFWETQVELRLGEWELLHLSLREVVNDGLMTIFFFVVTLEIKRELIFGELRDRRTAALPIVAAVGGMVVPGLIYAIFNAGTEASSGWGIPMATDIAFAVAVVLAVGPRVPASARLFLLTLAIVDDLGAITVIAVFYTADLSLAWLAGAAGVLVLVWVLRQVRVRSILVYVVLGLICWFMMHESGVHSTIAGVALAFLTPAWSLLPPQKYPEVAYRLVDEVSERTGDGVLTHDEHELNHGTLREIGRLSTETQAPLDRLEYRLVPWSSFLVIPLFAFANGGLTLPDVPVGGLAGRPGRAGRRPRTPPRQDDRRLRCRLAGGPHRVGEDARLDEQPPPAGGGDGCGGRLHRRPVRGEPRLHLPGPERDGQARHHARQRAGRGPRLPHPPVLHPRADQ